MDGGQLSPSFGGVLLVLGAIVALAVLVAVIYLVVVQLKERRSHRKSLPAGMKSNPNRFARYDEEDEQQ